MPPEIMRACPHYPGIQVTQAGRVYLVRGACLVQAQAHGGAVSVPYPPPTRGARLISVEALVDDAWGPPVPEASLEVRDPWPADEPGDAEILAHLHPDD